MKKDWDGGTAFRCCFFSLAFVLKKNLAIRVVQWLERPFTVSMLICLSFWKLSTILRRVQQQNSSQFHRNGFVVRPNSDEFCEIPRSNVCSSWNLSFNTVVRFYTPIPSNFVGVLHSLCHTEIYHYMNVCLLWKPFITHVCGVQHTLVCEVKRCSNLFASNWI